MDRRPTLSELLRSQAVTNEQINTLVAVYLSAPKVGPYKITNNITVDITAALRELDWTRAVDADSGLTGRARRIAVRTAILLAEAEVTPAVSSSPSPRSKARRYHPGNDRRG
jgi:hypothetical protein